MNRVHKYINALRSIRKAAKCELGYVSLLCERYLNLRVGEPLPLGQAFLVSTDKGIFSAGPDGIMKISRANTFGIAVDQHKIYISTVVMDDSVVLVADKSAVTNRSGPLLWRELLRLPNTGHAGRIHQLAKHGDTLWLTDTHRNLISAYDPASGQWCGSLAPFLCEFDHPITADHNHVNGVIAGSDYVAFTAFRAGKAAGFGLAGRGQVLLWQAANMGCHDCCFGLGSFWFTDSYRMFTHTGSSGVPMRNGEAFAPDVFDARSTTFIRGIASDGDVVLVGNSFTGARGSRFDGSGSLFLLRLDGSYIVQVHLPAAQIYDIVALDTGFHFPDASDYTAFEQAYTLMRKALGAPVRRMSVADAAVGVSGKKKFDGTDIGGLQTLLGDLRPDTA